MNKSSSFILDAQLFAYIAYIKEFENKTDSDNKTKNKGSSEKTGKNNI